MPHEVYLLPEDREYAEKRILELEQMIQDLGVDFNDAFTQSSETWHDNSPFEAVRDKQSMYAAELHQLRTLIRNSTLVPPRRKRGVINIGDRVTLDNGKHYRLAGDWTHKAGQHRDGVIWVSAGAPLAQQLCGKQVGEVVLLAGKQHKITEIIK
jgi:transcription elongation GreA/GreB family factor